MNDQIYIGSLPLSVSDGGWCWNGKEEKVSRSKNVTINEPFFRTYPHFYLAGRIDH